MSLRNTHVVYEIILKNLSQTKIPPNSKVSRCDRMRREVVWHMSQFGQPQDMMDACGSLVILQETYQLQTTDLVLGLVKLDGRQLFSDYKLSHVDMHFVAIAAANMKRYTVGCI